MFFPEAMRAPYTRCQALSSYGENLRIFSGNFQTGRAERDNIAAMPLTPEETIRRIVSARKLRGISQIDIGKALEAEGDFGLHDIARVERGEMHLTPGRRHALADILSVPEWWFTRPAEELFAPSQGDLARIESKLDSLLEALMPSEIHSDRMRRAEAQAEQVRQGSPQSGEIRNGPQNS